MYVEKFLKRKCAKDVSESLFKMARNLQDSNTAVQGPGKILQTMKTYHSFCENLVESKAYQVE
jgi:hypothetical protein